MQNTHYRSVHIVQTQFRSKPLIKFEVYSKFFPKNEDLLLTFWIPSSSLDKYGFVPSDVLYSRCKHDGKFTFSHYSALHQLED